MGKWCLEGFFFRWGEIYCKCVRVVMRRKVRDVGFYSEKGWVFLMNWI